WIGAEQLADAGPPARLGGGNADRRLLPRIAHGVAQPLHAVALDHAHRAAGMVGPYRLGTVLPRSTLKRLGDLVERGLPRDRPEAAASLGAGALQRLLQAVGMVNPLGVARDLG